MSLLDDVSIVVTPNAYKAGRLYGVLPVPTVGAEQVVNGDFSSNTWWTVETPQAEISGGKVNFNTSLTNYGIYRNSLLNANQQYKVVFTIDSYTSGAVHLNIGGTPTGTYNATGTYTAYVSGAGTFGIQSQSGGAVLSIDNVSCKEYLAADLDVTRATAATRVDENGLVNYAQVVGSEVVSCGNLECADPNAVWNTGSNTTIGGGKINSNSAGDYIIASQVPTPIILPSKLYKYTVEYTITSGSVRLGDSNQVWAGSTQSTSGTYTNIVTSSSSANGQIYFTSPSSDFVGSIDNISVKEETRNNVPRIDYTGGGCPHILAEPQRTNLVTYSEDFSQWNIKQGTETLNYGISPDGTQNSTRIVFSGANLQFSNQLTTGTPSIGSIYVKGVNGETINFGLEGSESIFTLNGEWQRIQKTGTATSNKITVNTYGGATARDIQVWGGQLEEGSYPTSYIPTSGSSVTRNTDQFSRDGISSLINSTAGVFFIEMAALLDEGTTADKWIALSDGTANNSVRIAYSGGANTIRAYLNVGGSAQADMTYAVTDVTQFSKIAFSYAANNFNLWVDGVKRATDTSGNVFSANTLNRVGLDNGGGGSCPVKIKQLQVYKTALTDAQLTSLTS